MSEYRPEEGSFNVGKVRIAVIAARWNAEITDGLLDGAVRAFARHGIDGDAWKYSGFPVPLSCPWPASAQRAPVALMPLSPWAV